ncbi:hypothetical protein MBANPS3_010086 [Mucor bainieri]
MSTALFSPMTIGRKNHLEHRVVLAPLTRFRYDTSFVPTDLMVEYYDQRTTPGGLLISEPAFITHDAGSYPQSGGIYNQGADC